LAFGRVAGVLRQASVPDTAVLSLRGWPRLPGRPSSSRRQFRLFLPRPDRPLAKPDDLPEFTFRDAGDVPYGIRQEVVAPRGTVVSSRTRSNMMFHTGNPAGLRVPLSKEIFHWLEASTMIARSSLCGHHHECPIVCPVQEPAMNNPLEVAQSLQAMSADHQTNRLLRLKFPRNDGPDAVMIAHRLDAHEALSRDFHYRVEVLSESWF
jgi:hypothetical protein